MKEIHFNQERKKKEGQVYTPTKMVNRMLDWSGYFGQPILNKHIIDNSCGEGAFLVQAVKRYLAAAIGKDLNKSTIRRHLAKYIHGIEKDAMAYQQCIENLNQVILPYDLYPIHWDVRHADALTTNDYDGQMDYVIGNPPYVRIQNCNRLDNSFQNYTFITGGSFDLYLAFFELGFRMLSPKGKLCYITPVSWIYSKAGSILRNYILKEKSLVELIDLQHFQVFEHITTYTVISRFSREQTKDSFSYCQFNPDSYDKIAISQLSLQDVSINDRFYFGTHEELETMRLIRTSSYPNHVRVKNGFATLHDSLFFNNNIPLSTYTIPTLKVSKGQWYKGFFPYDRNGQPVKEEELKTCTQLYDYLQSIKQQLEKRNLRMKEWWLYGRSQAIGDVYKKRIAINSLIRDEKDLLIHAIQPGEGVYNGFYVLYDEEITAEDIISMIRTAEFSTYIRLLKIYKSSGYYEFRAKDIEQYINYSYSMKKSVPMVTNK